MRKLPALVESEGAQEGRSGSVPSEALSEPGSVGVPSTGARKVNGAEPGFLETAYTLGSI